MSETIRQLLRKAAAEPRWIPDPSILSERARRRTRVRAVVLPVLGMMVVAGLIWSATIFESSRDTTDVGIPPGAGPPVVQETPAIQHLGVGFEAWDFDQDASGLWAAGNALNGKSGSLVQIDPEDPANFRELPLGEAAQDVAVVDGNVWTTVISGEGVTSTIEVGGESGEILRRIDGMGAPLAVSGTDLWGIKQPGDDGFPTQFIKLDTVSDKEEVIDIGQPVTEFAIDESFLWAISPTRDGADIGPASLLRVDTRTGVVTDRYDIGVTPARPLIGSTSIWMRDDQGVVEFDKTTGAVDRSAALAGFAPIAVDADGVWMIGGSEIVHVNSLTSEIDRRLASDVNLGSVLKPSAWATDDALWLGLNGGDIARLSL